MEETIYKILADEPARDIDTIAEILKAESQAGAPWFSTEITPEPQND